MDLTCFFWRPRTCSSTLHRYLHMHFLFVGVWVCIPFAQVAIARLVFPFFFWCSLTSKVRIPESIPPLAPSLKQQTLLFPHGPNTCCCCSVFFRVFLGYMTSLASSRWYPNTSSSLGIGMALKLKSPFVTICILLRVTFPNEISLLLVLLSLSYHIKILWA